MDDLISRRAAIDAIVGCTNCETANKLRAYVTKHNLDNGWTGGIVDALDAVEDLPSAQPEEIALHESCTDCPLYDKDRYRCPRFNKVIPETLRELQLAQSEQRWIPVSERLPEKGGEYLVSVHHTIGAISVFHPEKDTYVDDVAIMKYYGKFPSTVRAWMPLPEAYKGDEK